MWVNDLECCGVKELTGIAEYRDPKRLLQALAGDFRYTTGAYIFTQAGRGRYGTRLAAYIEQQKLGAVDVVPGFKNHNTGRRITLFVWRFNRKAVQKWYKAHQPVDTEYLSWI